MPKCVFFWPETIKFNYNLYEWYDSGEKHTLSLLKISPTWRRDPKGPPRQHGTDQTEGDPTCPKQSSSLHPQFQEGHLSGLHLDPKVHIFDRNALIWLLWMLSFSIWSNYSSSFWSHERYDFSASSPIISLMASWDHDLCLWCRYLVQCRKRNYRKIMNFT